MMRTSQHKTVLFLVLFLFCLQPISAEMSCEDMPCCASQPTVAVTESCCAGVADDMEALSQGCECTLESRQQPTPEASRALLLGTNYEFQARELVLLELPEELLSAPQPTRVWHDFEEALIAQNFVSYSAFPNPPPQRS